MDLTSKLSNIKNHLLDLAIRGKLVEQRPEEGTAEELYTQIQEEKKKLIAEGKIKKEKSLPEITEDEIPFEIPESWKWVHIGDLFLHNTGKALKSSDKEGKELEYITTSNVYWGRFELDDLRSMHFKTSEVERCSVNKGDLLVCEGGDFGRAAIWNEDYSICIQNHLHKLVSMKKELSTQFYLYLFYVYKTEGYLESRGIGIQSLSTNLLHKLVVPLPPLAEQKRIVAKLESYLAVISKAEELVFRRENLNEQIREKILDLAIRGKLVKQRPEEGTAEELYSHIQEEKKKLIAEEKIKKENPLPEIKDEDIPFDIPESWKWVRLIDIAFTQTGTTPPTSKPELFGEDIPFVKPADILNNSITYRTDGLSYEGVNFSRVVPSNSILMVCIGGSIGKQAIVDREVCFNQQINSATTLSGVSPSFVSYVLESFYFQQSVKTTATGTATPIIKKSAWEKLIVPLPPLAEQKRIVAKIEELLPYCDKLK